MIHETPIIRPLGDSYLSIEFGDEASLALSFRVLAVEETLSRQAIPGVIELQPTVRELAVVYDRTATTYDRLKSKVQELLETVDAPDELPSRLIVLPAWYDDPWSAEVARQYDVQNNIEYVAELNGLTVDEVIETHSSGDFWVVIVGFTPGCNLHYPLDPSKRLTAPKYKTPRTFTPARAFGIGGLGTAQYPVASPGGLQLIGRLAVPIYEPFPKNPAFPPDGVLLRAGDRLRYRAVDALEYEQIEEQVREGEYEYEIEESVFDVAGYLAGLAVDQPDRERRDAARASAP